MTNTTNIFRLNGKIQHYTWGGSDFIPQLINNDNSQHKPFAEYWMGAHDNVPADIVLPDGTTQPANVFLKNNPTALGTTVAKKFGRLPYLLKVLDVKDMLSIQVHPAKLAAEKEFADENKKRVPLSAPHRNYKDDNHKPEVMIALGEFWLLHGFKAVGSLVTILKQTPELRFLIPVFAESNYAALYKTVMEMNQLQVDAILQPLIDRIMPQYEKGNISKGSEDFWAARAVKTFCTDGHLDRGIFSIYFFNLVQLQQGDAIFQDAGILHAYLEGQNMELMANSDNVLRGGLTNKHVDVPELMKHVRFEPIIPQVLKGIQGEVRQEKIFPTPVSDFELHEVDLNKGEIITLHTNTAEIFFIYMGKIEASNEGYDLVLGRGETMLAVSGIPVKVRAMEDTVIFRATVPAIK